MASYRSTKLKITIGYTLLLAILLFSLVFVHREMEALSAADNQQNLRTDSLLTLLHEKDRNTIQMLRVLSEANDSLPTGTTSCHNQTRFSADCSEEERFLQEVSGSICPFQTG